MLLKLKNTEWKMVQDIKEERTTVMHHYTIRWDDHEKQFRVTYTDHITQESGFTLKKTLDAAKAWVDDLHIPGNIPKHFDVVE